MNDTIVTFDRIRKNLKVLLREPLKCFPLKAIGSATSNISTLETLQKTL
jgi:preprotein translocase subunit SecF